jgi:pyruvate formate lyase activating enzyme
MTTGVVFNIQRFAVHDGPGIRTTVFLKGCALGCPWCHNPESRPFGPVLSILPERCVVCDACIEVCPPGLARPPGADSTIYGTDPKRCLRCGACAEACPSGARTLVGRASTVDSLMFDLDKDRIFYDESGGGVTFSGGEPVTPGRNVEFLLAALAACRVRDYHTAVDTSGHAPRETLLAVAEVTDLFLYDLKLMDDELHRSWVGVGNRLILENLEALAATDTEIWVRVPLIPGVNDDERNLEATAAFVASLPKPCPIHLLPYHRIGGDKYRRLGESYPMDQVLPPSREHTGAIAAGFRSYGLEVKIGG